MRITLLSFLICFMGISTPISLYAQSSFYQTTNAKVNFYSSAPVEDIEATSNSGVSVLNTKNGSMSFRVKMRTFQFEKALMQEHFNENYMESEEFPSAGFKAQFRENINMDSAQLQNLILKGTLTIHGVSREREIPVTVQVSEDKQKIMLDSEFEVACKDHDIKIPKLLWENIAEVIEVKVELEYKIIKE